MGRIAPEKGGGTWARYFVEGSMADVALTPLQTAVITARVGFPIAGAQLGRRATKSPLGTGAIPMAGYVAHPLPRRKSLPCARSLMCISV